MSDFSNLLLSSNQKILRITTYAFPDEPATLKSANTFISIGLNFAGFQINRVQNPEEFETLRMQFDKSLFNFLTFVRDNHNNKGALNPNTNPTSGNSLSVSTETLKAQNISDEQKNTIKLIVASIVRLLKQDDFDVGLFIMEMQVLWKSLKLITERLSEEKSNDLKAQAKEVVERGLGLIGEMLNECGD